MPPSHFTRQDAGRLLLCTGQTQHLQRMLHAIRKKIRVTEGKSLSYRSKDLTPARRWRRTRFKSKKNLGYQSCPDKHASSNALNYAQIQCFQGREKSLFFLQKAKCPPVISQRRCWFLSEFSISKEQSATEFVDGKHQRREDRTACYGLPGFFRSARVIKFQRSPPAERPKERSCV